LGCHRDAGYIYIYGWWLTYPSEKYWSMGRIIPYMKWKIKFMFETTNQIYIYVYIDRCHRDGGFAIFVIGKTPNVQSWLP
jgi:hypothetical protein